jgi:hypothetical protein
VLESGQIRVNFDLTNATTKIYWAVNETEYLSINDGSTYVPISWGDQDHVYAVGSSDTVTVTSGVTSIWELYPPLADPTAPFTCHTDGQQFIGLSL